MADFLIGWFMGFIIATFLARLTMRSVYNCGIKDGYGFAKEEFNPDFQDAGDYLKEHHSERWPELAPLPADETWNDRDR